MTFFRRDRTHADATTLTMVRDVVEILAIVAAGIWAFYVFVYENRIKPSLLQPDVTITGSLQRTGRVHGMDAVYETTNVTNVGTTAVKFLAYSVTIIASRVVPQKTPWHPLNTNVSDEFARHYRISAGTPVYRRAFLTHDADPRAVAGLNLQPGATSRSDFVFYVPAGRYDRLTAVFVGRIQRQSDPPIKTTRTIGTNGLPRLGGTVRESDAVENDFVTIATLTLSGPASKP